MIEVVIVTSGVIGLIVGIHIYKDFGFAQTWVKIILGFIGGVMGLFSGVVFGVMVYFSVLGLSSRILGKWEETSVTKKIDNVYYINDDYYINIGDSLLVIPKDDLTIIEGDNELIINSEVLVDDEYWGGHDSHINSVYILGVPKRYIREKVIKEL